MNNILKCFTISFNLINANKLKFKNIQKNNNDL